MSALQVLATSMSCITISGYGNIDDVVGMSHAMPRPSLQKNDGKLLVRVLAVSLAPGDCRVMSGKTSLAQGPDKMPYIPGGDFCGVVQEVHDDEKNFKPGDCIVAMFDTAGPRGALAEYKTVKASHAAIKPQSISPEEACALPSSALSAMLASEKYVRQGDRVLVLGGSGGVGCHLMQMLKPRGASFVAATSTQKDLLLSLGADTVLDYRNENWWEVEDFVRNPFDLVFDLCGTREPWDRATASGAVKSGWKGGRYVTFVGDVPYPVAQSVLHIPALIYNMLARHWWTSLFRWSPTWTYHVGLEPRGGNLQRLLGMAGDGRLRAVLDPRSPFPFDAAAARAAFHLQQGRHQHGKVVIRVAGGGEPAAAAAPSVAVPCAPRPTAAT